MKEFAYGAYNDLVIDLNKELSKLLPEQEKIESIIFKEAMIKWAQNFFTARSGKEIDKRSVSINREGVLSEQELIEVAKSTPGIAEQIKACLFPNEKDIPIHITKVFDEFSIRCNRRLEDYNSYWHSFYVLQQQETKRQLNSLNRSTLFDPRANPQMMSEIMQNIWGQKVVPEVNKKIAELRQENKMTSDGKIPLAQCLNTHMHFIDHMVENAKNYISTTQKQLNDPPQNRPANP